MPNLQDVVGGTLPQSQLQPNIPPSELAYAHSLWQRYQIDPSTMSVEELENLRGYLNRQSPLQNAIGPYAHQAFTRQAVISNPVSAIPLAGAIPAYTAAKYLGLENSRSAPSMAEMGDAYKGILQGLGGAISKF